MNINEIANAATGRKKLSKDKMWDGYKSLIQILDNTDLLDGDAYDILTDMYTHFQPPAPAKPKTVEQWLTKALAGTNDVRYHLQHLYSDGDNLVATDGHRIHVHYVNRLLPGYYDKQLQSIKEDAKYPNYMRALESATGSDRQTVKTTKAKLLSREKYVTGKREIINVWADVWINKQYLADALALLEPDDKVTLHHGAALDPIGLTFMDCIAVIMPVRK